MSLHEEEVVVLECSRETESIEDFYIDIYTESGRERESEREVYDKELAYMSMESGKSKIR